MNLQRSLGRFVTRGAVFLAGAVAASLSAFGQNTEGESATGTIEEVVVTGRHGRRRRDS